MKTLILFCIPEKLNILMLLPKTDLHDCRLINIGTWSPTTSLQVAINSHTTTEQDYKK